MSGGPYVYLENKDDPFFTVGFYRPCGESRISWAWEPESDWRNSEEAAGRVNYLNGGQGLPFDQARRPEPQS